MAVIDQQEYRRLFGKIEGKIAAKRNAEMERIEAELEAERRSYIESLNRTWALDNDDPPPDTSDLSLAFSTLEPVEAAQGNGSQPSSVPDHFETRNDQIRFVIPLIEGDEISQPKVMDKLRELFPEEASYIQTPNISKVLRGLEKNGALKKVRGAHANNPTIYRRVNGLN
jgi:hypothetical protein